MAKTLFDKIWEAHLIHRDDDGSSLIYIDRHLVHEVTSPQAFEGLRQAGRIVANPERTLAVGRPQPFPRATVAKALPMPNRAFRSKLWKKMPRDFGVPYFDMLDMRQGIVHVIGPEQGFTQPGMTIVCGDSHTAHPWGVWCVGFWHRHV